jgi:hypothetical protein
MTKFEKEVVGKELHKRAAVYGFPKEWESGVPANWEVAFGLVLLQDYWKESSVVDGDHVTVLAYPNGTYEYTSVAGAGKTVRKYTAELRQAVGK